MSRVFEALTKANYEKEHQPEAEANASDPDADEDVALEIVPSNMDWSNGGGAPGNG